MAANRRNLAKQAAMAGSIGAEHIRVTASTATAVPTASRNVPRAVRRRNLESVTAYIGGIGRKRGVAMASSVWRRMAKASGGSKQ